MRLQKPPLAMDVTCTNISPPGSTLMSSIAVAFSGPCPHRSVSTVLWMLFSSLLIILNKRVYQMGFPHPCFVTGMGQVSDRSRGWQGMSDVGRARGEICVCGPRGSAASPAGRLCLPLTVLTQALPCPVMQSMASLLGCSLPSVCMCVLRCSLL
jgi:hypothetical protein